MDVVNGESIETPLSFINLIVKLRIPQGSSMEDESSTLTGGAKKYEQESFVNQKDAEGVSPNNTGMAFAHAPHWPQTKKPSCWVILGDLKANSE